METLRRVARVHRRWLRTWGRRVARAIALALIGAGGYLTLRPTLAPAVSVGVAEREVVREVVREVPRGPLLSVYLESPRAAEGAVPAPCPPIDTAIGATVGEIAGAGLELAGAPDTGVVFTEVVPSPTRARWLAARTADRVFLSVDDGRRFAPVLDREGPLVDIAFGCAGQLYAIRGKPGALELGVHGAAGDQWRPLRLGRCFADPGASHALYTGGGWLAVAVDHHSCEPETGLRTLWLSPDHGASWRAVPIPESPVVERLDVVDLRPDRVRVVVHEGDCMYDGTVVHDLDPRTGQAIRSVAASRDYQLWDIAVRGRWVYGRRGCDGALCRARLGGARASEDDDSPAWTSVQPPLPEGDDVVRGQQGATASDDNDDIEPRLLTGPRHIYSVDSRGVWSLSGGRARRAGPPTKFAFTAVDLAGRLLGVSPSGRLLRRSPNRQTRALPTVDNPPTDG